MKRSGTILFTLIAMAVLSAGAVSARQLRSGVRQTPACSGRCSATQPCPTPCFCSFATPTTAFCTTRPAGVVAPKQ